MEVEELVATARMARLTLSENDVGKLRAAVERMLEYFSHMRAIDVEGFAPTTHALLRENRLREDLCDERNTSEGLIDNAPTREERFIVIPNVL
jgi:aspartyl-tRNA(Asn)/glutamyl-tRNA(Gln) amidotransferase subunit C